MTTKTDTLIAGIVSVFVVCSLQLTVAGVANVAIAADSLLTPNEFLLVGTDTILYGGDGYTTDFRAQSFPECNSLPEYRRRVLLVNVRSHKSKSERLHLQFEIGFDADSLYPAPGSYDLTSYNRYPTRGEFRYPGADINTVRFWIHKAIQGTFTVIASEDGYVDGLLYIRSVSLGVDFNGQPPYGGIAHHISDTVAVSARLRMKVKITERGGLAVSGGPSEVEVRPRSD